MSCAPILVEPFIQTIEPGEVMDVPMRKRCERAGLRPYVDNLHLRAVGGSPAFFAIIFVPSGTQPQDVPTDPVAAFLSRLLQPRWSTVFPRRTIGG